MRAIEVFKVIFVEEKLYSYRLHGANSFKSLGSMGRQEFEFVARGVRERAMGRLYDELAWQFGSLGLQADWLGYR